MTSHDPEIATYLFEHACDILLVIDADSGALVDVNLAALLAYGYTRQEMLALTIFDLRGADPLPVTQQMLQANTEGLLFQTVHQRRDRTTFPVEVNSRGHTIRGRRMLFSVIRDISERRRLETEREALIATTQRALELRDEFLVVASHELRSPVTNVSLQLQQLLRLLERADSGPSLAAATQDALAEIARLSTLITTLLDAQVTAGEIVLARTRVDIGELLHEIAVRLQPRAVLAGSQLTIEIEPGGIQGEWDRLRLDQIFTNLLINALKYGRGRPIRVVASVDDVHVHIAVHDQGLGIAKVDSGRIFDKFERAMPAAYGGLGLGLYITRQLVDAHGGNLMLESVPGEGSTFSVKLPRSPSRRA